ncbi:MAG: signal recognition particle-docking protein FtsY [Candidatus Dependentiae bacterium]
MFSFFKNQFQKIYQQFTSKIAALFTKPLDEQTLKELEILLMGADTGVKTTRTIIEQLKIQQAQGNLTKGSDLHNALKHELLAILQSLPAPEESSIYLLVGINGSGKTTTAAKLASQLKNQGKKVLLVAADTFRAAATEQLATWAQRIGVDIVTGKENQDPASVVFAGVDKYKREQYDALIIDTAGRLQTKVNLMRELEKIKRVVTTQLPNQIITTLLTIDAMLGQNSYEQAKLFNESTQLTGIVLTKMDGTGKGGIVFGIGKELNVPVMYVSFGEQVDQLKKFNAPEYVEQLLG